MDGSMRRSSAGSCLCYYWRPASCCCSDSGAEELSCRPLDAGLARLIRLHYPCTSGKRRLPVRQFPSKFCATLALSRRLRMDGTSVSSQELYVRLGTAAGPVLVDVRRAEAFGADQAMIIGAIHRPPEAVADWLADLPKNREVLVYCVHGPDAMP